MRTIHFVVAALLAARRFPGLAPSSPRSGCSAASTSRSSWPRRPGDPRLFIVEREGKIRIWDGSQLLATPFLDITATASTPAARAACWASPSRRTTRRAARSTSTTPRTEAAGTRSRAASRASARARRTRTWPTRRPGEDPAPRRPALRQPQRRHRRLRPGRLPLHGLRRRRRRQATPATGRRTRTTLLGKMLRIDVAFTSFTDDYDVPADNPFVGADGIRDEIWDIGLRNPFRFSFDRVERRPLHRRRRPGARSRRSTSSRRARAAATTAGT